jgi:hypothetical protein
MFFPELILFTRRQLNIIFLWDYWPKFLLQITEQKRQVIKKTGLCHIWCGVNLFTKRSFVPVYHCLSLLTFLKTKLYLKSQSVTRCKHFSTRLLKPISLLSFWHRNFFNFLAHPVYKMWIIQEPKKVSLWNKRHFEEKEMEGVQHV